MYGHLVTIEVSIERGTYQRMQLDGFTFHQNRFERLDTQTMQGRCTVQHDRMLLDHFLKDIPNLRLQLLYHLFGIFNVMCSAVGYQLFHYERLEQLDSHLLWQTTLIDFKFRSYNDNGTTGIVDTFTQQILTETTGFTFQHIGKGFQRTVARSCYRTAAAAVIDQRIHSLLQHTFLVANNDIRSTQLQQSFQTIVTVNDSSVQIVQVGSSETSAVQLYHRTQIRRNYRDYIHDHPFRTVAGLTESLHNLQSLDDAGTLLTGSGLQDLFEFSGILLQIDVLQKLFDSFCTHAYTESQAIGFTGILIFLLCQYLFVHQIGLAGIQNDIVCEIQHFLQCSRRKVKDKSHTGRNTLEVPDMGYRSCQLDMSHTFTTNSSFGYLNAASVTDYAFVADFLIFTTMTFPVFAGSEDSLAEQTILFRFQGTVIDGLRLLHFAVGPLTDLVRRGQTDLDRVKRHWLVYFLFICLCHHLPPYSSSMSSS